YKVTGVQTCALPICALRSGNDGDLPLGIELDAVEVPVAIGDRSAQFREPGERCVPVHGRAPLTRTVDERFDHMWRRRNVRVAARSEERRVGKGWRSG